MRTVLRVKRIFLCLGLALVTICSAGAAVVYVRADAGDPGDGLSWASAFNSIPEGLRGAISGDELWVAAGTYRGPIQIPDGVALFGGFDGTEIGRTQRDWSRNKSVIDWVEWEVGLEFYNERFGPTVSLGSDSRLDGFTIVNGWHSHGAGVYAGEPSATIANNVILANRATGLLSSSVLVDSPGQLNVGDDFFMKTANDLLRMQFPFAATNIPVAQYTPAVHRLLQVAANVYDAARSNTFPSVFRPQFASTPNGPIISGYYQDHSADNVNDWVTTNPYAIPMIIGARQGFPNFNELAVETILVAARRLEMRRQSTNSRPHQTNEMYVLGIDNLLGVEAWNSYTNTHSNSLDAVIAHQMQISITNNFGHVLLTNLSFSSHTSYNSWPGFVRPEYLVAQYPPNRFSFQVPLFTNSVALSNGVYRAGSPGAFEPLGNTNDFVANFGFHTPEWTLSISNHLVFYLRSGNRIVDFVRLSLTNSLGLTTNLFNPLSMPGLMEGPIALCWSTNRRGASASVPTDGVQQQIDISLGQVGGITPPQWAEYGNVSDPQQAIRNFQFFVFPDAFTVSNNNTNLIQQAPFTPTRKLQITAKWEAADPLMHSMEEHLKSLTNNYIRRFVRPFLRPAFTNHSILEVNSRYRPWEGRPGSAPVSDDVDRRIKDAGVRNASAFDFPDGAAVNVQWLDRIHRGTAWQTLYFDRDVAPMNVWGRQSLDPGTHPTNDWRIIEYLRGLLAYSGSAMPTRVVNNTIVGNEGGLRITANASASVVNNAIVDNTSGVFDERSGGEFSRNCVFGNQTDNNAGAVSGPPRFVNPAAGDFSLLATSPLIDAGDDTALGWTERPVLGAEVDIGALEFGPDGVPVFTFQRTSSSEYELALRGFSGQSYVVEASTNLLNWTAISTNVTTMGSFILHDAIGTNFSHRFYRAKVANHPN